MTHPFVEWKYIHTFLAPNKTIIATSSSRFRFLYSLLRANFKRVARPGREEKVRSVVVEGENEGEWALW